MSEKRVMLAMAGATALVIVGGVWWSARSGAVEGVLSEASGDAKAQVTELTYDWGEISIDGGKVEKVFDIKNEGAGTLQLYNISTSCMCTTAQLLLGEARSPEFGMHSQSSYKMEVPAGETARLKVVFDPAFHGPSGVGPATRQIEVQTNDANQQKLIFVLTAMVRR